MQRLITALVVVVLLVAGGVLLAGQLGDEHQDRGQGRSRDRGPAGIPFDRLPQEAQQTVLLIRSGGPFTSSRDGAVFENREGRLPPEPRGYYHEYTVPTPGSPDRGPRRVVSGKGTQMYYTEDHYRSFQRITGIPEE